MDGPHTLISMISVYLRVIFLAPHTHVLICIVSGSATGFFSCGEISVFFAKIFFLISVVILNSSLHYQYHSHTKYSNLIFNIQILGEEFLLYPLLKLP